MKLALNVMVAGTMQLIAEALALGGRHGLDRARMLEVINGSVVGSAFTRYKTPPLVAGDYGTTFSASLMRKDLGLALDGGVPLPVTTTVQQRLDGCIEAGMGDLDFSVLVQLACTSSSAIT